MSGAVVSSDSEAARVRQAAQNLAEQCEKIASEPGPDQTQWAAGWSEGYALAMRRCAERIRRELLGLPEEPA